MKKRMIKKMSEDIENQDNEADEVITSDDSRLKKAVGILIKQSGIDPSKLEGKSVEEQFDLLSFYQENKPKRKRATGNKPVIPVPTTTENPKFGKVIHKSPNHMTWEVSTKDIISGKILEQL